jgi:hypothetical protein
VRLRLGAAIKKRSTPRPRRREEEEDEDEDEHEEEEEEEEGQPRALSPPSSSISPRPSRRLLQKMQSTVLMAGNSTQPSRQPCRVLCTCASKANEAGEAAGAADEAANREHASTFIGLSALGSSSIICTARATTVRVITGLHSMGMTTRPVFSSMLGCQHGRCTARTLTDANGYISGISRKKTKCPPW